VDSAVHTFLETDRLLLRRFTEADVDDLAALHGDPEVMRFVGDGRPVPRSVTERETLPRVLADYERFGGLGLWAAQARAGGAFLGWFEFRPADNGPLDQVELGYRLRREVWGHGYATEGARALVGKGFVELGVRRVYATTMAVNHGSRRVMEKVGLRYVRTFHEDWPDPIPGAEHGDVEYELLRTEWIARGAGEW
jgi:RimJ/RimL family protein N-acetyltransferase